MPVKGRHLETEYYEPRQYTELQVNKVPATYHGQQISVLPPDQYPTTSASGSIDEFLSNKNIDPVLKIHTCYFNFYCTNKILRFVLLLTDDFYNTNPELF